MQTASQNQSKAVSIPPHSKKKSARAGTIAAIHVTWKKINPLLETDELRDARLAFCIELLGLRKQLKSMTRLSDKQLGRVIDAMREIERAPGLPMERPHPAGGAQASLPAISAGRDAGEPQPGMAALHAEVFHLATTAQVETIDKLFVYLGWSAGGIEKFLEGKFRRKSQRLLTPAQANSCTMILFNIAASRDIRARGFEHATRPMIRQEIPKLKARLGIDQKKSADFADYTEEETENAES